MIIYGTGFKTLDFLAPMEVTGLRGRRLGEAWHDGAEAYLGISVAGFPNFFMLYGPNTNLGGNSILYMLEGQIGYVAAALRALESEGLGWIDVRPEVQQAFNAWVTTTSRTSVWESGCHSWYTTASGRNTNNWPDHTFLYRHRVRRFDLGQVPGHAEIPGPGRARRGPRMTTAPGRARRTAAARARRLRLPPALVRPGIRQLGRRVLDPGLAWETQRRRFDRIMRTAPVPRGTSVTGRMLHGVPAEVVTAGPARPARTVVHFHGGGYCLGSARMMRTWAAHLSAQAACRVVVPEYRLAPAHAHPAALDDAHAVLNALLSETDPASIVVSGDSAGGGLALSLVLALRDAGAKVPAGCILMSPWLDLTRDRRALPELVRKDLLLNPPWLEACAAAYAARRSGRTPRSHRCMPRTRACPRCSSRRPPKTCSRPMRRPWPPAPQRPGPTSPIPSGRTCGTTSPCSRPARRRRQRRPRQPGS